MSDDDRRSTGSDDAVGTLFAVAVGLVLVLSLGGGLLVGLVLGWVGRALCRDRPGLRYWLAGAFLVVAVLAGLLGHFSGWLADYPDLVIDHVKDFAGRAVQVGDLASSFRGYDWGRWFYLPALVSAPVGAWIALLFRPARSPEQMAQERADQVERQHRKELDQRRKKAARGVSSAAGSRRPPVYLGQYVQFGRGGPLWGNRDRDCIMPPEQLNQHAVVLGATRSGKTMTLLRMAYEVGRAGAFQVVYVDGKGDHNLLEQFARAMPGRVNQMVQVEGVTGITYNGFQGGRDGIFNRLVATLLPDLERLGDAEFYRTAGKDILDLVVRGGGDAPRSWAELLERLDLTVLRFMYQGDGLAGKRLDALDKKALAGLVSRVGVLSSRVGPFVDGAGWSLDDGHHAYFLLNPMSFKEDARSLARFLAEDLQHYLSSRMRPDRRLLVFFDEFGAVPTETLRTFQMQAAGLGGGLILSTQTVTGLGDDRSIGEFLGNAGTVFLHRLPEQAERVAGLAGTRRRPGVTVQVDAYGHTSVGPGPTGMGSITPQSEDVLNIPLNQVRALLPGECYIIDQTTGNHARVQVQMVSDSELDLVLLGQLRSAMGD